MNQDFFREKKANMKEHGRSGTLVTSEQIEDDYLSELLGVEGQKLYDKMLKSDSTIRKSYHAVSNPIRSAKWSVNAASDNPKDLYAAKLIEQIIFKDVSGGFKGKLDEILEFPWKGHAVFEVIHKNRKNSEFGFYTGLANLAFRDQRTLERWKFSPEGVLEKIYQRQFGDLAVDAWLPAENLLIFYNEKKGNDNGYAFLRMIYGNYKRKLLEKQLQIIGIEKGAIGVPILTIPVGTDINSEEYQNAVSQLESYTQAESAYMILPDGYTMTLDQNNTFDPSKVQVAIKAENEEIAGAIVAMWLEMGVGGNSAVGSSTAESLKFFRNGIEYIADKIKDKFNKELIPHLIALNFGEEKIGMPELCHSGISETAGKELMEIITGYVREEVLAVDEALEQHVRSAYNLPKKTEKKMKEEKTKEEKIHSSLNFNAKGKKTQASMLIEKQAQQITSVLITSMKLSASKYINDTIARFKQLPMNKKQNATSGVKLGHTKQLRENLKLELVKTAQLAIEMAREEIPSKKNVKLNNHERDLVKMSHEYGDFSNIKLNSLSKLPTYIQVLIAKQSELIAKDISDGLQKKLDFSFSSIATKVGDAAIINQVMGEAASEFFSVGTFSIKGDNVSALIVNEGRTSFFLEPEVKEVITSFTFSNSNPKTPICQSFSGVTFKVDDVESMRYAPPLHHRCKSVLYANTTFDKNYKAIKISTLSPSAEEKRQITL